MLLDDTAGTDKEIRHFLIGAALVEREPVAGRLVVDAQEHPSERAQILSDGSEVLVGHVGVDGQRQADILSVAADLPHVLERLALGAAAQSALIGEVIVIGKIPCKADIRTGVHHTGTSRPSRIQRIIAVHQTDAAVGSAQLGQNVILIDVFATLAAVPKIDGALGFSHMNSIALHVFVAPSGNIFFTLTLK